MLAIEYKWKEAGALLFRLKQGWRCKPELVNGRCDFCKRLQNANNGLRKPYLVVRRTGVTRLHTVRDGEEVNASTKLLVPNAKSSSLPSHTLFQPRFFINPTRPRPSTDCRPEGSLEEKLPLDSEGNEPSKSRRTTFIVQHPTTRAR